jgi:hypothetical protein
MVPAATGLLEGNVIYPTLTRAACRGDSDRAGKTGVAAVT